MVLAALAVMWVVVLGSYARERLADRRHDSVSAFHSQLSTLQRTQGRRSAMGRPSHSTHDVGGNARAMRCAAARRRRKNVLMGLLSAAVLMVLIAATTGGGIAITLAVLSVAAFTAYVALLVNRQRVITEQRTKVHPIRRPTVAHTAVRTPARTAARPVSAALPRR